MTVLEAFDDIIRTLKQRPLYICTDLGKEFVNFAFKRYCKDKGMKLIHPYSHGKAPFVERVHQTIQKIIWTHIIHTGSKNIIGVLDDVVRTYNTRPHSMLANKSPAWVESNPNSGLIAAANKKYLDRVNKYQRKPKFKIGDRVRVKKNKNTFDKAYDQNFNEEYYSVIERIKHFPINMYRIESLDRQGDDKEVLGLWYEYQLQKVDQNEYRIEQVIRREPRRGRALVKWRGFPPEFNSYVPLDTIRNLNPN